jgi:diamine N-acetyltransferase
MIKNDLISLRAVELDDATRLYQWENDMQLWRVSNTLTPFSRYQMEQYVKSAQTDIYQTGQLRLMIDLVKDQTVPETVGIIDLFDFDAYHQRAGVGVMIHESRREQGVASSALSLLIQYAFGVLGLHQIYCNIQASNAVSLKLFTSAGFQLIGVKKDWVRTGDGFEDELMLQLIKTGARSEFQKWEFRRAPGIDVYGDE